MEHGTNKPPPTEEFRKDQKETPHVLPNPESSSLESILAEKCMLHQEGPRVRLISQRQPEN